MSAPILRRNFIAPLGCAMIAMPFAALAQQPGRARRIAALMNLAESSVDGRTRIAAFREGLRSLGWVEGSTIHIDYRWNAGGDAARAQAMAKELLALRPELVLAQGTLGLQSIARQTKSLPIVFVNVSDPVGDGFVASLSHPGGNITGFSQYEFTIGGKWIDLLRELVPGIRRIAAVYNAANPASPSHLSTIKAAAAALPADLITIPVRNAADLERGLKAFAAEPNGSLINLPGTNNAVTREVLIQLAARYRLPATYATREDALAGGLVSYGIDVVDPLRRAAVYVDRILKGEKPADLPVQQPTKYELVINLKTAASLGIEVSPALSARADEVIE